MSVIHGSGKPRFSIVTDEIISGNTIATTSATSITLGTPVALDTLEAVYGLSGYIVRSLNNAGQETIGKITAYVDSEDRLTCIDGWSEGNPNVGAVVSVKDIQIDLPYCQSLKETYLPDFIYKKLFNGKISTRKRGFYYSASLDYSGFLKGTTLSLFRPLLTNKYSNITFYPRVDNLDVSFKVDLSSESQLMLYQHQAHAGHGGWIVNLVGTERLTELPLYTPLESGGCGKGYGKNYGEQL